MPVSFFPSSDQKTPGNKQNSTARKRRCKQNDEIDELGDLLPFNGKNIDKLSILRLTTSYMKFQSFMTSAYGENGAHKENILTNLLDQAMDGFLMVIGSDGMILYASDKMETFMGLSPRDVIGHSLHDLVETDEDSKTIDENLETKGTQLNQYRMFYIRLRNAITPGRVKLSRYNTNMMLQVSGHLKVVLDHSLNITFSELSPALANDPDIANERVPQRPHVLGLIVECRPIESCPSILELTTSQASFTSTVGMDMKIQSVDTRVRNVLGYDPKDFIGSTIKDYFHPMDHAKMLPCKQLLQRTGYACSPVFRFMTASGEWTWVQMEGTYRFDKETREPKHLDIVIKIISQSEGTLKYIEQQEFYSNGKTPEATPALLHTDPYDKCVPNEPVPQTHETLVEGLHDANVPNAVINTFLHSRELGLSQLPELITDVVSGEEEADKLAAKNLALLGKVDQSKLKESMNSKFGLREFAKLLKEVEGKEAVDCLPPWEISPPQSVLSALSPDSSVSQPCSIPSVSQPGSIPSVSQPGSIPKSSTYSVTSFDSHISSPNFVPTLSTSPQSVLSIAPSPNSAPPSVFSSIPHDSDSGIDSPLSAGSDSIPNGIKTESTSGGVQIPYSYGQIPFQNQQVQNNHTSILSFPKTDSTGYSFQPHGTTVPSSFNFTPPPPPPQQQQQQQQLFTQQMNTSPPNNDDTLEMLLTNLSHPQQMASQQTQQQMTSQQTQQQQLMTSQQQQMTSQQQQITSPQQQMTSLQQQMTSPQQQMTSQQQQEWFMKQQILQEQIKQQQKLLQDLMVQQKFHQMQQPNNEQQHAVHNNSVSSFTSSPSPSSVPNYPVPQSFGSSPPLPLQGTKDNHYGLNHVSSGTTNVSFVSSVDYLAPSSADNMSPSAALELQDLWQQLQQ